MILDRAVILDRLDKATCRAATFVVQRGVPISIPRKGIFIGSVLIEKNANGFFDILDANENILYPDISLFDVAIIVAQRHSAGEYSVVKKVMYLDERFSKYRNDMTHYLHGIRGAKKYHDIERMCILEDKFQVAEVFAKSVRDCISFFKRVR